MNGKQYVTDADMAATIEQECQTGDAERDRRRAGEILCQVLGSRDYDKTVAAFKEVLVRAELRPAPGGERGCEMNKLTRLCNSMGMHNDYEFFQDEPYIDRRVNTGSRDIIPSAWLVIKRGKKLSNEWYYNYAKAFSYVSREQSKAAFGEAVDYLRTQFNVTEIARSPFGGYGDKKFVEKRMEEIKKIAPPPEVKI